MMGNNYEETNNLEIKNNSFIKPTNARRIVSFLLDFVLFVLFICIFYSFVIQPITSNISSSKRIRKNYYDTMVETKLFYYDENENCQKITNNKEYSANYIDEQLSSFYLTFDKIETYNDYKKSQIDSCNDGKDCLFSLSDEKYVIVNDKEKSDEIYEWFEKIIDLSIENIYQNTDKYIEVSNALINMTVEYVSIALLISATLIYLIFPLAFKGQTIGKKMMGLRIYNYKNNNFEPAPLQILLRFFFFIVIELFIGIITYGLVPLISYVISINNKKGQSLHDFISSTAVSEYQETKVDPNDSFDLKAREMR